MAITKAITDMSKGANLLRPELSLGYIAAGTVSVIVLMLVWKMGGVIFDKGGRVVQGHIPAVQTTDYAKALGIA